MDVLLQDIRELEGLGQRLKRMDYEYDLLSGNVHQVSYQAGQWDEFHHRYRYDADNRLLDVRTSRDGRIWERDARYFYYAHGPLARTELGDKQVQGTDHYYTIQGWLKGVNGLRLDDVNDAGKDGLDGNINQPFTRDAMAYALTYHNGDYSPVGGSTVNTMAPAAVPGGDYSNGLNAVQLYNGNIPSMLTALQDLAGNDLDLHANVYRYDLLNRIKGKQTFAWANTWTSLGGANANSNYATTYTFDGNGNFKTMTRRDQAGALFDEFAYNYTAGMNQLTHVDDNILNSGYSSDLEDQATGNYAYDAQGRLTQDILAGISAIAWNLQDKVRSVSRASTNASAPNLEFRYGATGHRTVKVKKPRSGGVQQPARDWERTYYIHNAQGNPMAIYHRTYQANGGTSYTDRFMQEDALIYGSKRLGNWHGARLKQRGLTSATTAMTGVTYSAVPSDFWTNGQGGYPTTAISVTRELGLRHYELANHLGNVLSTVSDRRLAMGSGSLVAYYRADEKSYADYDPYGMLLPGRFGGGFADQNFGFQGQLKDDELNGSAGTNYAFEYRFHDPRVGRFFSIDPLSPKYPENSTYAFSRNRTIDSRELEGLEDVPAGKLGNGTNIYPIESTWTPMTFKDNQVTYPNNSSLPDLENPYSHFLKPLTESAIDGLVFTSSTITVGGAGFCAFVWGGISTLSERGAWHSYEKLKYSQYMNFNSLRFSFDQGVFEGRCLDGMSGEVQLNEGLTIISTVWGLRFPSAANRYAAKSYLKSKGYLESFDEIDGFSLQLGYRRYAYNKTHEAAEAGKWFTSELFENPKNAWDGLALDYKFSQNYAQVGIKLRPFGITIKGTAARQNRSLGGANQYLRVEYKGVNRCIYFDVKPLLNYGPLKTKL